MSLLDLPAIWQPQTGQRLFRALLDAMARPGRVADLTPWLNGAPAWLGVLAALMDNTQSLADLSGRLDARMRGFLECQMSAPDTAGFVLADGATPPPPGFTPALGTLEAPERGATLILIAGALGEGASLAQLSGPGIAQTRPLACAGLDSAWLAARGAWTSAFPLGCELILAGPTQILAIPRSTRMAFPGG